MSIHCNKLVEVPINSTTPKPYLIHDARKIEDLPSKSFDLHINIQFFDIVEFFNAMRDIYFLYK